MGHHLDVGEIQDGFLHVRERESIGERVKVVRGAGHVSAAEEFQPDLGVVSRTGRQHARHVGLLGGVIQARVGHFNGPREGLFLNGPLLLLGLVAVHEHLAVRGKGPVAAGGDTCHFHTQVVAGDGVGRSLHDACPVEHRQHVQEAVVDLVGANVGARHAAVGVSDLARNHTWHPSERRVPAKHANGPKRVVLVQRKEIPEELGVRRIHGEVAVHRVVTPTRRVDAHGRGSGTCVRKHGRQHVGGVGELGVHNERGVPVQRAFWIERVFRRGGVGTVEDSVDFHHKTSHLRGRRGRPNHAHHQEDETDPRKM